MTAIEPSIILGVDVGAVGAIAALTEDGELISVENMPVLNDGPAGHAAPPPRAAATWRRSPQSKQTTSAGDLLRVLAKSVAERLTHAFRMPAKRGKIAIAGKERGAIVWRTALAQPKKLGYGSVCHHETSGHMAFSDSLAFLAVSCALAGFPFVLGAALMTSEKAERRRAAYICFA